MHLGFSPELGARGLERVIERQIARPLAEGILDGRFTDDAVVEILPGDQGVVLCRRGERPTEGRDLFKKDSIFLSQLKPAEERDAAMLLLDIVKSTGLVQAHGDDVFCALVTKLHAALRAQPWADALEFVKCTGDGFLALYPEVPEALAAARAVRQRFDERPFLLRYVLHWGRVKVGPDGDPLGVEVHRLFRVEAIGEKDRVGAPLSATLPEHSRIVATGPAVERLPAEEAAGFEQVGAFRLKGFEEPEPVWAETGVTIRGQGRAPGPS
jgi:class 3 adenylate cyclase